MLVREKCENDRGAEKAYRCGYWYACYFFCCFCFGLGLFFFFFFFFFFLFSVLKLFRADVTFTSDGWIFSGSTDATCVLWDSLTFEPAVSFACLSRVCAVAASPQGHIFAAGDGSGTLLLLSPVDLPKSRAEQIAAEKEAKKLTTV